MKYKFVYFIKPVGMAGPIKIGCAMDLARRLNVLEACSPFLLEVAASVSGGLRLERQLHAYFAAIRVHREWFRAAPDLLDLIKQIRNGANIEDVIPIAGVKIPRTGGPKVRPDIFAEAAQ
jgi:hypothetical protein